MNITPAARPFINPVGAELLAKGYGPHIVLLPRGLNHPNTHGWPYIIPAEEEVLSWDGGFGLKHGPVLFGLDVDLHGVELVGTSSLVVSAIESVLGAPVGARRRTTDAATLGVFWKLDEPHVGRRILRFKVPFLPDVEVDPQIEFRAGLGPSGMGGQMMISGPHPKGGEVIPSLAEIGSAPTITSEELYEAMSKLELMLKDKGFAEVRWDQERDALESKQQRAAREEARRAEWRRRLEAIQANAADSSERFTKYMRTTLTEVGREVAEAPEGARNTTLFAKACHLSALAKGTGVLGEGEMTEHLVQAAMSTGLGEREARTVVARAWANAEAEVPEDRPLPPRPLSAEGLLGPAPPPVAELEIPPQSPREQRVLAPMVDDEERPEETIPGHRALTVLGNAERMADAHGSGFRHCSPLKSFFVWDGRRWREDEHGIRARELACDAVRRIYEEAADTDLTTAARELLSKHAVRSESENAIAGIVALARSLPGVKVEPEQFDADPYLLNARNGTVDLRTGELRRHRREDFISRMAPVKYDPSAEAPLLLAFLDRIFEGDRELISFVQRFLGYCLTADCSEQVMGVCHGEGSNGKSTLLTLMHEVLGTDYAVQLRHDFLLAKKWQSHPEELAQLRGRRFACAIEVDEGSKLDEARVKHLTGNDRVSARRMYGSSFDFAPSHKFLVGVNDKPHVQGMDEAIWRRLLLIPFRVQIPPEERDLHLGRKLLAEAPSVLAWLVRGCLDWQRQGLSPPAAVVEASAEYRRQMDTVRQFLESESCILGASLRTRKSELRAVYERWCEQESLRPASGDRWGKQLRKLGLKEGRFGHESARVWEGVALARGAASQRGDE